MLAAEENGMRGRRDILTGLAASLAGMPLAAILADPVLARAAARELERVTLHLDSGARGRGLPGGTRPNAGARRHAVP